MARDLSLILVGFGVVGQALANHLVTRGEEIRRRSGHRIKVVGVVDSKSSAFDSRGLKLAERLEEKRRTGIVGREDREGALELIRSADADVMVELTPGGGTGGEPGLSHFREALDNGMNVVAANKMPLALEYSKLTESAKRKGLAIRYGACVGAGLPVLEFGDDCSKSEPITRIDGVLNATSNYILTTMEEEGMTFMDALSRAQRAGYAEPNPDFDIQGTDAACKIVILANHVLGKPVSLKDVRVKQGIAAISSARIEDAKKRRKKVRMVASVEKAPEVRVLEVPEDDMLSVKGASNAVRFRCKYSGDRVVAGQAAGGAGTSAAILRDILAIGDSRIGGG